MSSHAALTVSPRESASHANAPAPSNETAVHPRIDNGLRMKVRASQGVTARVNCAGAPPRSNPVERQEMTEFRIQVSEFQRRQLSSEMCILNSVIFAVYRVNFPCD